VNLRCFLTEVILAFTHEISCDQSSYGQLIIKNLEKKSLKTELKANCNKYNWEKKIKGEAECPLTNVTPFKIYRRDTGCFSEKIKS